MSVPVAGWIPLPKNFPPEHWPLPEQYSGVYFDPAELYAPLLAGCDPVIPTHVVLMLGDVGVEPRIGYGVNSNKTMQVKLKQNSVFGVLLFDTLTIAEILEKCFPIPTTCVVEDSDPLLDCSQAGLVVGQVQVGTGATLCTEVGDPGMAACSVVSGIPVPTVVVKPSTRVAPDNACIPVGGSIPYV